jgi:hypothetical protein
MFLSTGFSFSHVMLAPRLGTPIVNGTASNPVAYNPAQEVVVGRSFGYLGLLIVLCVAGWLFTRQAKSVMPEGAGNIRSTVDIIGVKNDLLAIANAERGQFALEGKYLPLDELRSKGVINLPASGRGGYTYSVDAADTAFRVVASYSGPAGSAPRTITIDQTMEMRTE